MKNRILSVNNPSDLEQIVLEPCLEKAGFYYFPDDKRIAVSKEGEVYRIKTNKILNPSFNKKNNKLYIIISSPDTDKHSSYIYHRILARTFIGRPSRHLDKKYKELEVNHIDGNRLNNKLNNIIEFSFLLSD